MKTGPPNRKARKRLKRHDKLNGVLCRWLILADILADLRLICSSHGENSLGINMHTRKTKEELEI